MSPSEHVAVQQKVPWTLLCQVVAFSTLNVFKPLLAYNVYYLVQVKGFTNFQVTNKILPLNAYGLVFFTLLAAPACESLSYKRVINICTFATLASSIMLRFGSSLYWMQLVEVFTAAGGISYAIFQAYIFLLIPSNKFQTLTSINQATVCLATFLASELSQILVLMGISYNILLYINMGTAVGTCILGLFLPKDSEKGGRTLMLNWFSRNLGIWSTVKDTWKDRQLQILSIWWVVAYAGFELSLNYSTTLFEKIGSSATYNGQVLALATACAFLASVCSAYVGGRLSRLGGMLYVLGSAIFGALCLTMGFSRSLFVAYPTFVVMLSTEKLLICLLYAQCGQLVKNAQYMLLFGFNTGLGLLTAASIQAIVEIAQLDILSQYVAFGSYYIVIAMLLGLAYGVYRYKTGLPVDGESARTFGIQSAEPLLENHAQA